MGAYLVMVANFGSPQPQHAPEWNEDAEKVGEKEHGLGFELEVSLDVPEPQSRGNGANRLCDAKVGNLQE